MKKIVFTMTDEEVKQAIVKHIAEKFPQVFPAEEIYFSSDFTEISVHFKEG